VGLKFFIVTICFGLIAGLAGAGLYFLNSTPSVQGQEIVFEVNQGEPFARVSSRLFKEGLISNYYLFRIYGKLTGAEGRIRAGEYLLSTDMYPAEVMAVVSSGRSIEHAITFQEGLNRYDMADIVEREGIGSREEFIDYTEDQEVVRELLGEKQESLEGYLFPSTYNYTKYTKVLKKRSHALA
jgi:UPF0755 protein